jgi:hypothetical protein
LRKKKEGERANNNNNNNNNNNRVKFSKNKTTKNLNSVFFKQRRKLATNSKEKRLVQKLKYHNKIVKLERIKEESLVLRKLLISTRI